MNAIVPLFLLAPLVLVPLGYRLLEVVSPGSRPPASALRLTVPAAALLVLAFWLPAGPVAAALALPWVAITGATAATAGLRGLRDPARFRANVGHATDAAVAYLAVGAVFAFMDRLGVRPFGFSTTIILLTAVHFHFAGFVLPLAGALAYRRRPVRWLEGSIGAVVVGIPITAIGFFGLPLANWTGAILTAGGGFGIGMATLVVAGTLAGRRARVFAVIAGASLLVSMPMAVIYATGTLTGAAWLGMDLMARVHGGLNAVGFALPVMIAWTSDRMARTAMRAPSTGRPAGPIDVMGFNAAPFVLGPVAAALAAVVALTPLPIPVRLLFAVAALVGGFLSISAIVAVVWVFGIGADRRWAWIASAADTPRRWVNVTTGFDDSTATLHRLLPATAGEAVDVFDPAIDHETALLAARRRFPTSGRSGLATDLGPTLGDKVYDAAFLLMSAHETRGRDRDSLFEAIAKSLSPCGRLVLVEHLRDRPNRVAFGPGASHFQSRETWVRVAADAGLALGDEVRLTPYARGFVFVRAPR